MTTAYLTIAHLVDWQTATILIAAIGAAALAGAIGGDRADADKRGSYDAGIAQEVQS